MQARWQWAARGIILRGKQNISWHYCFVEPSTTRIGNLGSVFAEGRSELLREIARICILYEDLRLEIEEIRLIWDRKNKPEEGDDFRFTYFIRRALVTLMEFQSVVTAIRLTKEFKRAEPSIARSEADDILHVTQYFQRNGKRLNELRNEFGGHIQPAAVRFATEHLSDVVGKITMNRSMRGWTLGLDCHFASSLVAGVISSKLASGTDAKQELRTAMDTINEGFVLVQPATAALVLCFLWDRFGLK